jgi:hypothetical protein
MESLAAQDLQSLGAYEIAVRLMVNGQEARPFSGTTLKPLDKNTIEWRSKHIITNTRKRCSQATKSDITT